MSWFRGYQPLSQPPPQVSELVVLKEPTCCSETRDAKSSRLERSVRVAVSGAVAPQTVADEMEQSSPSHSLVSRPLDSQPSAVDQSR